MTDAVLITGGASGIGRAIGRLLAKRGCAVVLADRQAEAAEEVARELVDRGHRARAVELDVRDPAAFERVAAEVEATEGSIDLFFNNAGIGIGAALVDHELADWDDVLDVNVRGVAYGIQAVYPRMVRQRSGHIVNTASVAGLLPITNEGSYTMAKHAVVGLSRSLRIEAKHHGVKVSALCPGAIKTPILTGGVFGRIKYDVTSSQLEEVWEMVRPMDVDDFAVEVMKDVAANRAIIVVPRWWKVAWWIDRLAPDLSERLWQRLGNDMLERIGLR